jgi:diguanylate cyclase (GGDEF)-like protein
MAVNADDAVAGLQAEFPHALRSGQLVAYFQPEVELFSGRVVGAESLARWEHPDLGTLSPALFVPLAEKLGLMDDLTQLMLRLSLAQHRTWAAEGRSIPVSVNAAPVCVTDPGFPAVIAEQLRRQDVPGHMLVLEVSEQTGTAAVGATFFAQLAELGVRISLDDFGTGFASLESLGGWPVDELKLDVSIVKPIASNPTFRAIVRNTIDLAHQLGVKVVAQGVESDLVRTELQALGCDIGQGFLLGRPMPADRFADWLREREHVPRPRGVPGHRDARPDSQPAVTDSGGRLVSGAYRGLSRARGVADRLGGLALAAALAMLAVYALWQVFRWGGHRHQALIGDLAFFPVNGAAALWAWRVSRRQDLGPATCRAWRLLSVAFWLYLLGNVIQLLYEVVLHRKDFPSWDDPVYLSFYPVAFAGLLAFPSPRRTLSERFRLLLDAGTVFIGGATVIWYTTLGPAVSSARGFDLADLVLLAYPVGDLLLLFGVLSLLWRGAPRSSILSLQIFATGMILFIVGDITYDYLNTHSGYLGGDPVDTLWIVALAMFFVAAACQLRASPQDEFAAPQRPLISGPSVLPYLAVAGSFILLMVVGLRSVTFDSVGGVLLGAVLLTVLVSVRQFAALQDNSRLTARYAQLASIDEMTGLSNRRHLIEVAESALAHAQRLGQPLAVLLIDVDHFKQINDVYGHAAGDRVLADVAQACREQVRPDDIIGRYGGDEFVIVIPQATSDRAAEVAARLAGPLTGVTRRDGTPVMFTISVGIAESVGSGDLPSLLARADLAMYEAKKAGGACFRICYEPCRPSHCRALDA